MPSFPSFSWLRMPSSTGYTVSSTFPSSTNASTSYTTDTTSQSDSLLNTSTLLSTSLPFPSQTSLHGPLLLKSHIMTFWIWLVIRLSEAVDGHCGYDFWFVPFRYFPFRPGANVHDYHHSHNVGNYGSFFIFWDRICGTDVSYQEYQKREANGACLR